MCRPEMFTISVGQLIKGYHFACWGHMQHVCLHPLPLFPSRSSFTHWFRRHRPHMPNAEAQRRQAQQWVLLEDLGQHIEEKRRFKKERAVLTGRAPTGKTSNIIRLTYLPTWSYRLQ